MIPLTVPELGEEEIAASERVLRSGMLVQGKEVLAFEQGLARYLGRQQAVAVVNGTAALELALRALDIAAGDEVVCPALTWPSPAHAVKVVGGNLVLADVHPEEWNLTPDTLRPVLSERTRAVIVVEQFGNPARHQALQALLSVPLIVDSACSLGSLYRDQPCGKHGLISCTSFHPRKVITTGEGGACFTDDARLADKLRMLRNHGQIEPGRFEAASGNYRLTEQAAAIGSAQLLKLDDICARRRALAAQIMLALPGLQFQRAPEGGQDNRQTLGILLGEPGQGSATRDAAIAGLIERGVQAGRLSYALHELPQFAAEAQRAQQAGHTLSTSSDIAARGLCVPLFPRMTDAQLGQVVRALGEVTGAH